MGVAANVALQQQVQQQQVQQVQQQVQQAGTAAAMAMSGSMTSMGSMAMNANVHGAMMASQNQGYAGQRPGIRPLTPQQVCT